MDKEQGLKLKTKLKLIDSGAVLKQRKNCINGKDWESCPKMLSGLGWEQCLGQEKSSPRRVRREPEGTEDVELLSKE